MWRLREATRNGDAAIVRQFALIGATVVFFASQSRFRSGELFPWVIVAACVVNVGVAFLGAFESIGRRPLIRAIASLFGIATWSALIRLTDGVASSPFLPSLWLEVLLSALTFSSTGIALITAGAAAALWIAEPRPDAVAVQLVLHTMFLIAMGTGVLLTHRRWRQAQSRLSHEIATQTRDLHELQSALEDARAIGEAGEGTARLAHRLKNAVHSLRGFARLVETEFQVTRAAGSFEGLHLAIDQLDLLAVESLAPVRVQPGTDALCADRLRTIIDGAVTEACASYPALRIERRLWSAPHVVRFPAGALRDIVHNLLLNSAEATHGHGRITIETDIAREGWHLHVHDDGPGIAPRVAGRLFRPGTTSKPDGHGVGLFVCQRQAAAGGGRLWADAEPARGGSFHVLLPIAEPA